MTGLLQIRTSNHIRLVCYKQSTIYIIIKQLTLVETIEHNHLVKHTFESLKTINRSYFNLTDEHITLSAPTILRHASMVTSKHQKYK